MAFTHEDVLYGTNGVCCVSLPTSLRWCRPVNEEGGRRKLEQRQFTAVWMGGGWESGWGLLVRLHHPWSGRGLGNFDFFFLFK